jgi:hypothetical protein
VAMLKMPNFCAKGLSLGLAIFSVAFFCKRFHSTCDTFQLRAFLKPPLLIVVLLTEGSQVFVRGVFFITSGLLSLQSQECDCTTTGGISLNS